MHGQKCRCELMLVSRVKIPKPGEFSGSSYLAFTMGMIDDSCRLISRSTRRSI